MFLTNFWHFHTKVPPPSLLPPIPFIATVLYQKVMEDCTSKVFENLLPINFVLVLDRPTNLNQKTFLVNNATNDHLKRRKAQKRFKHFSATYEEAKKVAKTMLNKTIDILLHKCILALPRRKKFFEIYVQTKDLKVNNGSRLHQPPVRLRFMTLPLKIAFENDLLTFSWLFLERNSVA